MENQNLEVNQDGIWGKVETEIRSGNEKYLSSQIGQKPYGGCSSEWNQTLVAPPQHRRLTETHRTSPERRNGGKEKREGMRDFHGPSKPPTAERAHRGSAATMTLEQKEMGVAVSGQSIN